MNKKDLVKINDDVLMYTGEKIDNSPNFAPLSSGDLIINSKMALKLFNYDGNTDIVVKPFGSYIHGTRIIDDLNNLVIDDNVKVFALEDNIYKEIDMQIKDPKTFNELQNIQAAFTDMQYINKPLKSNETPCTRNYVELNYEWDDLSFSYYKTPIEGLYFFYENNFNYKNPSRTPIGFTMLSNEYINGEENDPNSFVVASEKDTVTCFDKTKYANAKESKEFEASQRNLIYNALTAYAKNRPDLFKQNENGTFTRKENDTTKQNTFNILSIETKETNNDLSL